eukprot:TRINITY_DN15751_c0_g1_i1.p1 TRINITY_DN15751_c0_g1~~TRINITY_DN15751_c0_g1_i1.p1  ORF type:complete len:658 (-),score=239.57 TRINITY_DN15751_c0_g1_i1:49-2022(-)
MAVVQLLACLGLLVQLAAGALQARSLDEAGITGVKRVLQMLEMMKSSARDAKLKEELSWAKQKQWCTVRSDELNHALESNDEEIENLVTENERLGVETLELNGEISKLQREIESWKSELSKANEERANARSEFVKTEQDYRESVDALDRAVKKLQEGDSSSPSFLQLSDEEAAELPDKALRGALLQEGDDVTPEARAYEFQSGGIVDMMKKLYDDFKQKLWESQKEESAAAASHELVVQQLEDSISVAEQDLKEKQRLASHSNQKVAENKNLLTRLNQVKEENQKAVEETRVACRTKKETFQEQHKVLGEEEEAIGKAQEIISQQVSGSADKLLGGGTALAMLRSSATATSRGRAVHRQEVRQYLDEQSRQLQSEPLALLVQKLDADPFVKVKKMIQDLLTKMMDEAHQDAAGHGYCDREVAKNKLTRTTLSERVEALDAEVEETKASVVQLAEENEALAQEVKDSTAAYYKASEMRQQERYENKKLTEESRDAQGAVVQAIEVLKKFYGAAAQKTDKAGGEVAPLLADSSTSVVAMLEVVHSDFVAAERETMNAEAAALQAFKDFEAQFKEEKAVKQKQIEFNTAEKARKDISLKEHKEELHNSEIQLDAANRYYEKLQGKCGLTTEPFKAHAEQLQKEIKTLKHALTMLTPDQAA